MVTPSKFDVFDQGFGGEIVDKMTGSSVWLQGDDWNEFIQAYTKALEDGDPVMPGYTNWTLSDELCMAFFENEEDKAIREAEDDPYGNDKDWAGYAYNASNDYE